MIVVISGFIGSGKDTVANYLVEDYGFRHESFAKSLKDAVSAVFGWDRILLEGKTDEARAWREQVDPWWSNRLGISDLTPRFVLQYWGTEVCRKNYHNDIWIASLEKRLLDQGGNVVISDCRFPNEIKAVQQMGAKLVRVDRGAKPDWYDLGLLASKYDDRSTLAATHLKALGIHESEWALCSFKFDHIIDNNGSFDDLYAKVRSQVLNFPVSNSC